MSGRAVTLRLEAYAPQARRLIASAQALADDRQHREVEPLHLLYRTLEADEQARSAIERTGADPDDVLVEGELLLRQLGKSADGPAYLSPRMLELLGRAEGEAARQGGVAVDVSHLLLASAQDAGGSVRAVMASCGLSAPLIRAALSSNHALGSAGVGEPSGGERRPSGRGDPLERHGKDLTRQATQGRFDPTVGRDQELRRVLQVLARRHRNNPLLVGESGVGKDAIVRALAMRMARGDVPGLLSGKRLVELDAASLMAGTRLRGEMTDRLAELLQAVRDRAGETIVYLRELDSLLGERAPEGVASLLSRSLRDGELRAIAVADPVLAGRILGDGHGVGRHFVRIDVDAPSEEQTVAILRGLVRRFESAHALRIGDPALKAAARFAKRYLPSVQLPRSAIDLIDEAAARVRVQMQTVPAELDALERRRENLELQLAALADDHDHESTEARARLEAERAELDPKLEHMHSRWRIQLEQLSELGRLEQELSAAEREEEQADVRGEGERAAQLRTGTLLVLREQLEQARRRVSEAEQSPMVRAVVGEDDVAAVVSVATGIPVERMLEGESDKLLRMEQRLSDRVIGQPRAVGSLARAVRRGRMELRDPRRPIGSFLFLGTSGVGKTELAKALAAFLFDDEAALTRLDMSEFMEKHTVARLLGAPPGYVDSEEGGFLTEAVRRRPYSVLLFDEIEKAHPDVFNILLQVLDDGRLSDSRGRLAHFNDTVIILTSNIGSRRILEHEASDGELEAVVMADLRAALRPEFLNRIDDIIVFETLDRADLRQIADLQLDALAGLLAPRKLGLQVSDAAKDRLVELGYDPAFGARPLRRVITRELQDPLAEELLRGHYPAGSIVVVDLVEDEFVFRLDAAPESA